MTSSVSILALVALAQAPLTDDREAGERLKALRKAEKGMPSNQADCPEAELFGGTPVEKAALCWTEKRKYVSARTLADKALRENPRSFRAHYLMGVAQHHGEGNLPKALFHLQRAEKLFVERFGERPGRTETEEARVYHKTLLQLVYVHGEMDHHLEKIRYVDALQDRLGANYQPLKAWPLLKLKRFDEAREIAQQAADSKNLWYQEVGKTALCAVESELRNRDAAYEACSKAARPMMRRKWNGSIELSNAGAAAEEMFAFDEAERLFLEATKRKPEGSVNPWGRLVRLYVRQGRFAEAVSAWREMREYRKDRPSSYLNQQDQSEADMIGASVLMVAGREKDALPITSRTVARPDRQGTSSASSEQNEAGAAIVDMVVRRAVARRLEEEASTAELWDGLKLRAEALKLRLKAWAVERRAAEALADPDLLVTSLRPECPGSIELPPWLDAEVIGIVGPGVALAALEKSRAAESLPADKADQIFLSLEAEAHLLDGDEEEALEAAKGALEILPVFEAMLRARVGAVAAEAARRMGRLDEALGFYRIALAADPGIIRRLGLTLPVVLQPQDDSAPVREAVDLLKDSPLFEAGEGWGFDLSVGREVAILGEADGSEILRVRIPKGRTDSDEAIARRIARAIHAELLVPNVDITQADIRSLDGSLGSGGKANERVKSILDEVIDEGQPDPAPEP